MGGAWCEKTCTGCLMCHLAPCEPVCELKDGRSCLACAGCVDGDDETGCPKWCETDCEACGACVEQVVSGGPEGDRSGDGSGHHGGDRSGDGSDGQDCGKVCHPKGKSCEVCMACLDNDNSTACGAELNGWCS